MVVCEKRSRAVRGRRRETNDGWTVRTSGVHHNKARRLRDDILQSQNGSKTVKSISTFKKFLKIRHLR